jgi:hypothetical protein
LLLEPHVGPLCQHGVVDGRMGHGWKDIRRGRPTYWEKKLLQMSLELRGEKPELNELFQRRYTSHTDRKLPDSRATRICIALFTSLCSGPD